MQGEKGRLACGPILGVSERVLRYKLKKYGLSGS